MECPERHELCEKIFLAKGRALSISSVSQKPLRLVLPASPLVVFLVFVFPSYVGPVPS